MRSRLSIIAETIHVVRPIFVTIAGITVIACAMAMIGWHQASMAMGFMILLIALMLVYQVHRSVSALSRQSKAVRQAAHEAEKHYLMVLRRIVNFSEVREQASAGRAERIGRLAEEVSREMALPEATCELMNLAGQLHDIGLLAIPHEVLNKKSSLTGPEYTPVREHSEISFEVLQPLEVLSPVLDAIRHHHERMNGTGYPAGLKGEQVPVEARVLAVVDAYDAMTHDRPHRPAMTPLEALRELKRCSPAGFDPDCVRALAKVSHLDSLEDVMEAVSSDSAILGEPAPAGA